MPPDDEPQITAQEQEENESYQQITDMLKANDLEGGTIRINRRGPGETSHSYCTKIKVQEFDIEFVKKTFGGGDYLCQCFRANGQLGRRFSFSIDARFKGSLDTSDRGVMSAAQDNGSAMVKMVEALRQDNKGNDMTPILQTMMKASSDNMAMMMAMMQQSTQMMTSAMTSIATMAASGKKEGGGDESMKALVPVLVAMINKPSPPAGSIEETVKTMALLKGMYEPQGGGDGEDKEEGLLDKVFKLGGPLISALVASRGGAPMVVPPQRQLPAPGGQPQHQPQQQPQHQAQQEQRAQEQQYQQPQPVPAPSQEVLMLGMFLHGAEKGSDPGLYHDLLMDLVQENQVEVMEQVLKSENYLDLLYGSSPDALAKAKLYKSWFDELRDLVLQSIASTRGGMLSGEPSGAPPAAAQPLSSQPKASMIDEDETPQDQ